MSFMTEFKKMTFRALLKLTLSLVYLEKEEYKKTAATLNEARQELSDKVRELSKSSSKEPLVEEAEKHSQSLQALAKQLEE